TEGDDIEDGATDAFPSGKADGGIAEGSPEALGVLAAVNAPLLDIATLKAGAHVSTRVATNILKHRAGLDGVVNSADDDAYDTLAELDQVAYVGPATLDALLAWARGQGLVKTGPTIDVIFSPQVAAASHNARIAKLVDGAQHDVDIAIYSYSDAGISSALAAAVQRGVHVRFLFDTATEDRKLVDAGARAATKSGKLEALGVDVRYVNQINHHKFVIVDGPRDDAARAATAKLVMGSANFSSTGGTVFDENTLFVEHSAELAAAYQHEFDVLWRGSRDFAGPAAAQPPSTANIDATQVADDPGIEALFTSPNFKAGGADGTTWRVNKDSLVMSDQWVTAIEHAQTSIHIASTHLRLRPVVEALIAKKQADPAIDIKLYIDQQEFISKTGADAQAAEAASCVARSTTSAAQRDCLYDSFLFSRDAVDAGLDLRFKSYTYRWDATFAIQQHSKYMIVDGKELLSGSYNLSMNSEHGTFENALHVTGPQFAGLLAQYEQNFRTLWDTNRANATLANLRSEIATASTIPLVFPPIALTYAELESIRALIRANCTAADSPDFRSNPAAHKTCPR
ncbi:MAG: phosphatidylserine/phosphatidylglycerophosphate/cardiolipin synthase family protein, partial [Proteobacteria bacterium]|nr:phosphatidylserine/phosphatidylglycerophosphate/cardiolipin synthase family protein [Pseudomonadota bacterium]